MGQVNAHNFIIVKVLITDSETQLLHSLKNNDRIALKTIFSEYHAPLCSVAYRVVNDEDDAKDVVQDVFIKLWNNRENLDIKISLKAYLKRAVVNTALNHLEKNNKVRKLELDKVNLSAISKNLTEEDQNYKQLSLEVDQAVDSLPQRTKAVFTLIRHEQMSYKEVAEALDISTKAVEKEIMKALRLLREALKNHLYALLIIYLL